MAHHLGNITILIEVQHSRAHEEKLKLFKHNNCEYDDINFTR